MKMKKKFLALVLSFLLVVSSLPLSVFATGTNTKEIVILYENDVHCVVEGYSKLSAMKKELQETYAYVGVVSGGDYIQGNSLGVISQGEYIAKLMNLVGYDAVALGNHEFDYRLERLDELIGMMDTKPVCCNFQKIGEEASYYKPYSIVSYGDVEVAYIGITTPSTLTSSSPAQFKDENGNFLYTFHSSDLYDTVQKNIDSAKAEGADYVVAISHIGYAENEVYGDLEDVETLIMNTSGFDVVLDAHSHSVIEKKELADKGGNTVLLSSTGTKFANIGKLILSEDGCKTQLIATESYEKTDPTVSSYIEQIYQEYAQKGERKVAFSEVDLKTTDENGNRLVRNAETNLGNLCADAFRYVANADIGYVNGGGLRADLTKGDVTFNHLLSVLPFNNTIVLAEITGQNLKDMIEMAVMVWPAENGAFPHLSGVTFTLNTKLPSSVVLNEFEEFAGVSGEYRAQEIKIFNSESGSYEPLDLNKTYTIAAANYYLLEYGSGMKMLENVKVLENTGLLDVEALEQYVVEQLGGKIGQEYAEVKNNITFAESAVLDTTVPETTEPEKTAPEITESPQTGDDSDLLIFIFSAVLSFSLLIKLGKIESKKRSPRI